MQSVLLRSFVQTRVVIGHVIMGALVSSPSPAFARGKPYYEQTGTALQARTLDNFKKADAKERLRQAKNVLKRKRAKVLQAKQPDGSWAVVFDGAGDHPDKLPREAALAVFNAASVGKPGLEADVLVNIGDGGVPVSVWWDGDVVKVEQGKRDAVKLKQGATVDSIQQAHHVVLREGDAHYSAQDLAIVDKALALLDDDEKAYLKNVPFVRVKAPVGSVARMHGRQVMQALYVLDDKGPRVEVYDALQLIDDKSFSGPLHAPLPYSVGVVLHEALHAIAKDSLVQWRKVLDDEKAAYEAMLAERKTLKADYDVKKAAFDKDRTQANKDAVETVIKQLNALSKKAQAAGKAYSKHMSKLNRGSSSATPLEKAFTRVVRQNDAVTVYGRTSPGESIAEAFKLFKVDPDALKRIAPKAFSFFADGKHLALAKKPAGK